MADTIPSQLTAAPSKGLVARVVGVLTSPRATYADIVARPRSLSVLLVVLVATVVPSMVFTSTEVGRQALIDRQIQTVEAFGGTVTDAQYRQIERLAPFAAYFTAASQIVGVPLGALVVSGIVLAIFNGILGADASFAQVFAVVTGSAVVTALRTLFATPLNYARETLSSPTSLAAVLPLFDDNTFPARLLGSIDLFLIWWIVNLAIGLGVLYRRRTAPIAMTMLIAYGTIGLGIALVRSVLAGT